jgi:hypothetical protein
MGVSRQRLGRLVNPEDKLPADGTKLLERVIKENVCRRGSQMSWDQRRPAVREWRASPAALRSGTGASTNTCTSADIKP